MNRLFHINVFSQISPAPSSPIEWWDIGVVAPSEGWNPSINKIRTAVATGLLALSLSAGAQERPTATVMTDNQPILLAQAATETDGKVYVAEVIQVDGTKKTIKYFRDAEWAIIPPPIVGGKLVDGNIAPDHPLRAKNAQVKILAKYDKIVLAKTEKNDLIRKADKDLKDIVAITKKWDTLTREQLFNWFFSIHLIRLWLEHEGVKDLISWLESIAKIKMKMNESEIAQIKRDAESRAINIWKSVAGALA